MGASLSVLWTKALQWYYPKIYLSIPTDLFNVRWMSSEVSDVVDRLVFILNGLNAPKHSIEREDRRQVRVNHLTIHSLLTHGNHITECMRLDRPIRYDAGQPQEWISPIKETMWLERFLVDELGYTMPQSVCRTQLSRLVETLYQIVLSNHSGKKQHYIRMMEPLLEDLEQLRVV